MNKAKLFIENFIVYGFGGVISKFIPLIMLPIITKLMPNTMYFGINDMSNTIVSFARALCIMGMYDAMYRLFFDDEEKNYKIKVCSTALVFTILMSVVVSVIMFVLRNLIAELFLRDAELAYVICLSALTTLVSATNQIISAPTRMQNKRKVFLITNFVSPMLSYGISIPMLLRGHFIIALPLAAFLSGLSMEATFFILNRDWFSIKDFDLPILKQLLAIAIPLFPNFLIYWVFNSCDKLMITNILSIGEEGVYSIGSKLGHASQLIYTAFAGGWQYYAFSTMKEDNQVRSNSSVFEYLGVISFIATAWVCVISKSFYKILFPEDYAAGYIVAPYLFLAPLLQMLFQVASNQFLVIKKTWPNMLILAGGAILNILLNRVLIPRIGIEGAAIATLIGYIVSVIVVIMVLSRMKLIDLSQRFVWLTFLTIVFFIIWRTLLQDKIGYSFLCALIFSSVCLYAHKSELSTILVRLKK